MRILFVEDTESYIKRFKPVLEEFGEVVHFRSSNGARRAMGRSNDEFSFDLVVCDHYIHRFEEDGGDATGDEVYLQLRYFIKRGDVPFLHFSSDPCPRKYEESDEDENFYVLRKDYSAALKATIEDILGEG
jgi:CheY-like chemotaxis protein